MGRAFAWIGVFTGASLASAYIAVERRLPVPTITLLASLLAATSIACLAVLAFRARASGARVLVWTLLGMGIVPVSFAAGVVSSRLVNDWRLSLFARQLVSQPPPGARATLRRARVGVLSGNGNHCDYVIELLVQGDVREDSIVRHFQSLRLERAVPGQESSTVQINVAPDPSGGFAVMFTDAPNAPTLDWRCR